MFIFLSKHKKLALLIIAFLFFVVSMSFLLKGKIGQTNITSQDFETWRKFEAGKTTKDDVVKQLGNPVEEKKVNNNTVDTFSSQSQTRQHQIVFDNNNVSKIFKEIITATDAVTPKDLIQLYGETLNILYGADAVNGVYLYVYPSKGVAYLGNNESNTLFEIWYFTPTSLDNFIKQWAPDFSKEFKSVTNQE